VVVDRIGLAQVTGRWWALVSMVMIERHKREGTSWHAEQISASLSSLHYCAVSC
jgi:hypothetical protein